MAKFIYMKTREGSIIKTDSPHYWPEMERMTAKEGEAAYHAQCAAKLRKYFKPGDTAYTQLLSVSSSGMSRHIAVIATEAQTVEEYDGKKRRVYVPVNISALVGGLLDYKQAKDGGLVVGGCGMDMGFHVIYAMSSHMWPKGTPKPHGRRNGEPDSSGGYAINHRWL